MRRTVTWAMSTVSAVVLLMSYHTSTSGPATTAVGATPTGGSGSGATSSTPSASATSSSDSTSGSTTYTGSAVSTQWGPVQVAITVSDGKIVSSEAVVYPNENHKDVEINDYALPILGSEVVDAQSASIDAVSGATVTSVGYISSLQSALDKANL